jgi:glycosyltransferase involved in cell wall biosynthesis
MSENQIKNFNYFTSFSIIIETENLVSAELENLFKCLDSLVVQTLSPKFANEVIIIDSGDVPNEVINNICQKYPWLSFHAIEKGSDYYGAKMKGASLTTGEVIVFCDSDCVYKECWLQSILAPFSENADIQIVSGETVTPIDSIYDIAIALTYIFPRFSNLKSIYQSSNIYMNNVAFKQSLLMQFPLQSEVNIYRGNCVLYTRSLCRQGYKIWKQPQAQATHAVPSKYFFFWRFLLLGNDAFTIYKIDSNFRQDEIKIFKKIKDLLIVLLIFLSKLKQSFKKASTIISEDIRHLIYLTLSLPIAILSLFLFFIGLAFACLKPGYLLTIYEQQTANQGS